jgi:hypothetical protein
MNHTAISLIVLGTTLVAWDPLAAVFLQKTNAMFEQSNCTSSNNNNNNNTTNTNMTCTGAYQKYSDVTFDDLILRIAELKITHNDTVVRKMNIYPYNTSIPFLLPFP